MLKQAIQKSQKSKFKTKNSPKAVGNRRARLIIRNLPFDTTEKSLREHFSSYGAIDEVTLLKRPDGKSVGCGFVQFVKKQSAAKAIHYVNGKPFLGRVIIVDWAIPKNKFEETSKSKKRQINKESSDNIDVKDEPLEDSDIEAEVKTEPENSKESKASSDEAYSSDSSDNNDNGDTKDIKSIAPNDQPVKIKPKPSHDIHEGKTVFLKNVPFTVTNDELKSFMEQNVGPVYYAVICVDPLTEHSKGTGFVKFKDVSFANHCLQRDEGLKLKGSILKALPALQKRDLNDQNRDKHPDKKKDNRNLYLVKEGVIIAGTQSAVDVSMSDMKKRLELEVWKTQMLKNLNMFVSKTRLIIHNLPLSCDDKMLKSIFKKHSPPNSRIIEAKVMRNLRQLGNDAKPVSKGHGFVSFIRHEDALVALRKVNNNPTIFNKNKRPIVAFSIENRAIIEVKKKRMEKSRKNNPLCPPSKKPNPVENDVKSRKKVRRTRSENVPSFAGMESHFGQTVLPTKRKILSQVEVHSENVKEAKRKSKRKRRIMEMRREKKREPKPKKSRPAAKEKSLVRKMSSLPEPNRKKWYE